VCQLDENKKKEKVRPRKGRRASRVQEEENEA
jgi:hypothetical protein